MAWVLLCASLFSATGRELFLGFCLVPKLNLSNPTQVFGVKDSVGKFAFHLIGRKQKNLNIEEFKHAVNGKRTKLPALSLILTSIYKSM